MTTTRRLLAATVTVLTAGWYRAGAAYAANVPDISPDSSAPGAGGIEKALNAFGFYALLACAFGFVVSVAAWAIGGNVGNDMAASRGKIGAFVALGAAFLLGAATVLLQFAYDTGSGG